MTGYITRWFTSLQAGTHPSGNNLIATWTVTSSQTDNLLIISPASHQDVVSKRTFASFSVVKQSVGYLTWRTSIALQIATFRRNVANVGHLNSCCHVLIFCAVGIWCWLALTTCGIQQSGQAKVVPQGLSWWTQYKVWLLVYVFNQYHK